MRRAVLAAAGLALLAAVSWSAAPAQAMAISAPAALKGASDSISLAETVHCWGCGYYGGPRYYDGYYGDRATTAATTGRITAPTTDRIIGPTTRAITRIIGRIVRTTGLTGAAVTAMATTPRGRDSTSARGSTGTDRRGFAEHDTACEG